MRWTKRLFAIFSPGDIVRIPFPHLEGDRVQVRPALVVSRAVGPDGLFFWALMITSARRSTWPGDVSLRDRYSECGLAGPCVIRTEKIAVFELARVQGRVGRMPHDLMTIVHQRLMDMIGLN